MTTADKRRLARELTAEGWSRAKVAERFGCTPSWVSKMVRYDGQSPWDAGNRERRNAQKARWSAANEYVPCPRGCGRTVRFRPGRPAKRCAVCYHEEELARTAERGLRIVEWWAAGLTRKEIAAKLGWSRNRLAVEMGVLRGRGFDLPRRPPGGLR